MKAIFTMVAALLALAPLPTASAHEGHRDNVSDAEMAGMPSSLEGGGQACMEACMEEASRSEWGHEGHWMPVPGAETLAASPALSEEEALAVARERNRVTSFGDFLGRIHPVAVHFPVALLLMAALAELLLLFRPALGLGTTIRFLVGTGAVGAVIAALLGWFAGGWRFDDRSETLALHRWNGTGIAVVSLLAWWLATRVQENRAGPRLALAALVIGLIAQGYWGGEMVFGPNHLGIF